MKQSIEDLVPDRRVNTENDNGRMCGNVLKMFNYVGK